MHGPDPLCPLNWSGRLLTIVLLTSELQLATWNVDPSWAWTEAKAKEFKINFDNFAILTFSYLLKKETWSAWNELVRYSAAKAYCKGQTHKKIWTWNNLHFRISSYSTSLSISILFIFGRPINFAWNVRSRMMEYEWWMLVLESFLKSFSWPFIF